MPTRTTITRKGYKKFENACQDNRIGEVKWKIDSHNSYKEWSNKVKQLLQKCEMRVREKQVT